MQVDGDSNRKPLGDSNHEPDSGTDNCRTNPDPNDWQSDNASVQRRYARLQQNFRRDMHC